MHQLHGNSLAKTFKSRGNNCKVHNDRPIETVKVLGFSVEKSTELKLECYFDLVKQGTCILTLTYIFRSEKMRTFIVISFLIASVLSHKDRHDLPYDGAILRRNGDLIPGKHYQFHWTWLIYKNLIAYSIFRGNFMHLDENI